jgi:ferredoxin-NADP reductase/predicted pyridoxine 5'-phosphate oxidase superfamily flavin-nucleotide-binding protein
MSSPFHEGEQQIQSRLGVREGIEPWARKVVRPFLPEEHRAFYAELPFIVLAARDRSGRPFATLLAEEPGFVSSPDPQSLRLGVLPSFGDALGDALAPGSDIGLLGIELATRRRNRVNGRVAGRTSGAIEVSVEQSFGNCPQYITPREWRRASGRAGASAGLRGSALSEDQADIIRRADTFFIASGFRGSGESETFGMDASHRGGSPGFVSVLGPGEIVFPDYAGNNHFNTLGNLLMDPRVGIVFVDFERGGMLQLTGHARIDWDGPAVERFAGARRLVHIDVEETVLVEGALPIRWETSGGAMRELRVLAKRRESADVVSFLMAPRDDGVLPGFSAGQHLPIELDLQGEIAPVRRTYSLSSAPGDLYRISVKREPQGLASRHLHDTIEEGDFIRAGMPQGSFTLDPSGEGSIVLVSAGVGLTPLVSMLHDLVSLGGERRVLFVHGARDGVHHPLRREIEDLAARSPKVELHVAYSRPRPEDLAAADGFQSSGRVDSALLEKLVPELDADFYLCGPIRFMAEVQSGLEERGVAPSRIRAESFGPAA